MTSEERSVVRQGLVDADFTRTDYTNDLSGHGDYIEWWRHTDGSTVRIEWGWRSPKEAK